MSRQRRDPQLVAAIEDADARLQRMGINDRLRIKFRTLADPSWLGQYRSFSQFRGGAESPAYRDIIQRYVQALAV